MDSKSGNPYKEQLIDAVNKIVEIRETLFDAIVPLALEGELKEWNDTIENGEYFTFTKDMFEGANDINIKLLMELLNNVDNTFESLVNLNNLKIEGEDE